VDDMQLPDAPRWVRTLAGTVRRLPAGRYRAVQAIVPRAASRFIARLPDDLGGSSFDVVDLMKMDIEGAEGIALDGLQVSLLGCRVKRLLLELQPAYLAESGRSTETIRRLLERARYLGWSIDHSPAAVRRAAYGGRHHLPALAAITSASSDLWPHELWVAPGASVPEESTR
jgi:Methyltransferase FkbM domain